jgi:hypothetical protein
MSGPMGTMYQMYPPITLKSVVRSASQATR